MQPARRPRAKLPPRKPFFPKVRARWLPARRPAGIPGDEIEPRRSTCHDFTLTIEVRDRVHLARVMKRLRQLKSVRRIARKRG